MHLGCDLLRHGLHAQIALVAVFHLDQGVLSGYCSTLQFSLAQNLRKISCVVDAPCMGLDYSGMPQVLLRRRKDAVRRDGERLHQVLPAAFDGRVPRVPLLQHRRAAPLHGL